MFLQELCTLYTSIEMLQYNTKTKNNNKKIEKKHKEMFSTQIANIPLITL